MSKVDIVVGTVGEEGRRVQVRRKGVERKTRDNETRRRQRRRWGGNRGGDGDVGMWGRMDVGDRQRVVEPWGGEATWILLQRGYTRPGTT